MTAVVERLDDLGKPAWIAVMVLGFILFWPIGLGILAYLIWSGRMACGRQGDMTRWQQRMAHKWERKMERFGMQGRVYPATGNAAFDEYRAGVLRRLEEEATEFRDYLERLRRAKDKAEFDQFMSERRGAGSQGGNGPTGPSSQPPPAA
jgi:hypothetical protein